jgi:hypothetical protein
MSFHTARVKIGGLSNFRFESASLQQADIVQRG